jgi:glucose-6-phosphate 1-dehydrogenase
VRDVVQNHILQVIGYLAMEPPVDADAESLRDEKVKVLKAIAPADPARCVRGQYDGYLDEPGVAAGSTVETFAALPLEIDSWRWAGVPFHIRAGKALATTAMEIVAELRAPPRLLFSPENCQPNANFFRFRLGRHDGVTLTVQAKEPGERLVTEPVDLDVDFQRVLGPRAAAYERLLVDAIDGNPSRFAREDSVENAWRVVQPLLDRPGPIHRYPRGSWGPAEADSVVAGAHGWRDPTTA